MRRFGRSTMVMALGLILLLSTACGRAPSVPTATATLLPTSTPTPAPLTPTPLPPTPVPPTATPTPMPPTATPTVAPTEEVTACEPELGWCLPPTTPVDRERNGPRLVNYAHRHDILEYSGISSIEERLAQWKVIILNPDHHLSLDKIRKTNPYIRILVWISLQGPHPSLSLHRGFRSSWNCKTIDGKTLIAPWIEPLANRYADDYGYLYHVLDYLEKRRQRYDGVLYDCGCIRGVERTSMGMEAWTRRM